MQQSSPTIRDVAVAAGVSTATVSRALNELRSCRPSTRAKVLAAVEKLGFQKNQVGSLLRSSLDSGFRASQLKVGLVVLPLQQSSSLDSIHHARALGDSGHLFEFVRLNRLEEMPDEMDRLHRMGCGALILDLHTDHRYWEEPWAFDRFSIVTLTAEQCDSPFHQVTRAYYHEIRELWRLLVGRGYSRIGASLMKHNQREETDFQRLAALLVNQSEYRDRLPSIPPFLEAPGAHHEEDFRLWLLEHRPEVLISFGIGDWWLVQRLGYRVPEELGHVFLHGGGRIIEDRPGRFALTGYKAPNERLIEASLQMLDSMVRRGQTGIPIQKQFLEMKSDWVEADTLR